VDSKRKERKEKKVVVIIIIFFSILENTIICPSIGVHHSE
jgi:hypothetical protein